MLMFVKLSNKFFNMVGFLSMNSNVVSLIPKIVGED